MAGHRAHRLLAPMLVLVVAAHCTGSGSTGGEARRVSDDGVRVDQTAIADTAYPVPSDALFVSVTGDDAHPGSERAPFRTLRRAVAAAPPGATIVLRAGTYREQVPDLSKMLTFQPYPHEQVWLKGSVTVDGWHADRGRWRHDGWTTEFCRTCVDSRAVDSVHPLAGWPDMLFVDGRPLVQVDSVADVVVDRFYIDDAKDQIYLGTSPAGHLVEVSTFPMAMNAFTPSAGSMVRGLGFAHYAPHYHESQTGMVRVDAPRFTIENNTFVHSAFLGLALYGSEDTVVRGNTFLSNGGSGFGAYRSHRLVVEGNRVAYSNRENFDQGWAVAGAKLARVQGGVIRDNVFEHNRGKGFWCDVSCYDFKIIGNTVRSNKSHGIFYEISSKAIVARNVVADNGTYGLRIDESNDVQVWNNTFVRNAVDIGVADSDRTNNNRAERAMGISWNAGDVRAYNNLLIQKDSDSPAVLVRDRSRNPFKPASRMVTGLDYNGYVPADPSASGGVLVEWWQDPNGPTRFTDLDQHDALAGAEEHGLQLNEGDALFVDGAKGDYRLRADSPAVQAGRPMPPDVAEALATAPERPVNLGAFLD